MDTTIISISLLILGMFLFPYITQAKLYDMIDDKKFKRLKINKLHFLFCGIGRQSPKKHGLVRSLFAIQLLGYIVSILSVALVVVLRIIYKVDFSIIERIILYIFGGVSVLLIVVTVLTSIVSERRQ